MSSISTSHSRINVMETDKPSAGFSPSEYSVITESIAKNILAVQKSRQKLDQIIKWVGGPKDTVVFRDEAKQIQVLANENVQKIKEDLQRLNIVMRNGDKLQKFHVEKLRSNFQDVVGMYSSCQKQIAAKMKANVLINASQLDDINKDASNSDISIETDCSNSQQRIKIEQRLQFEHQILVERQNRLQQIEVDIVDINKIMQELNTMVYQQGEQLDVIEETVHRAVDDVEAGREQLEQAAKSQAKCRRKSIILLIIAAIIGAIVIGIVVAKFKK